MSLKGISILVFLLAIPSFIYAFQVNEDYIILKDGTKEYGSINVSQLESVGLISFSGEDGERLLFGASDISEFSVNGKELIRSLEIKYAVTNSRDSISYFFAKRIFEGPIHLEQVYAAPFEYAITKDESTNALQRIQNENLNRYFDRYKGVFYLAFRDCFENLNPDNIKFNESGFRTALKQYRACKDPEYTYQREVSNWSVFVGLGRNSAELSFIATNRSRFFEEKFFTNYKKSSELNFYVGIERMIYKEIIYSSFSIGYQKYSFIHSNRENQRNVGNLNYSELIFGLSLDFRYPNKYLIPTLGGGLQYHNVGNGTEGAITGELNTTATFSQTLFYREYLIKATSSETEDYYMPFVYAGLMKKIYDRIDLGLRIKWINRDGEHFTKDYDRSDDNLSGEFTFSLFVLLGL